MKHYEAVMIRILNMCAAYLDSSIDILIVCAYFG